MPSDEGARGTRASKAIPASLSEYLVSDCPAGTFAAALDGSSRIPDERERAEALQLARSDPKLLSRIGDLARSVLDSKRDPRTRRAILTWASEVIRSRNSNLARWGLVAGANPDVELGELASGLRRARSDKDRAAIAEAEQVLGIGLAVASARSDFSVIGTLSGIFSALNRGPIDKSKLNGRAQKLLAKASPKILENLSVINKLAMINAEELRQQMVTASNQLQDARERGRMLQETFF